MATGVQDDKVVENETVVEDEARLASSASRASGGKPVEIAKGNGTLLKDIPNVNLQHKSPLENLENVLEDHINQILKENNMMVKLIEEKDKIIHSNELELQRLRLNLHRAQQQNFELAQDNIQMTMDGKTKPEEAAVEQPLRNNDNKENNVCKVVNKENEVSRLEDKEVPKEGKTRPEEAAVEQLLRDNDEENNVCKVVKKENEVLRVEDKEVPKVENKVSKSKRASSAKSQSMGASTSQQAVDKEIMENKRRCLRRQSMRLKSSGKPEDFFEIDAVNSPVNQTMDCSRCKSDSYAHLSGSSKRTGSQILPVGRQQRKAAEKILSYKDPPLNTKMRRPILSDPNRSCTLSDSTCDLNR